MEEKYLNMIQKAQEFMNENHFADVSRVQCLLRKIMSKEYHDLIDQIKECQDPHVIFNIHGGNNLIAPNANGRCRQSDFRSCTYIQRVCTYLIGIRLQRYIKILT